MLWWSLRWDKKQVCSQLNILAVFQKVNNRGQVIFISGMTCYFLLKIGRDKKVGGT